MADIVSLAMKQTKSVIAGIANAGAPVVFPNMRGNVVGFASLSPSYGNTLDHGAGNDRLEHTFQGSREIVFNSIPLGQAVLQIKEIIEKPEPTEDNMLALLEILVDFMREIKAWYPDMKKAPVQEPDMEYVKENIAYVTATVASFSLKMANVYAQKREAFQAAKNNALDEKASLYKKAEADKENFRQYDEKQNYLRAKLDEIRKDVDECVAEIISSRRGLEDIRSKIESAKKWCWVPFYNIVLLIDGIDAESKYETTRHRLENAERKRNELLKEAEENNRKYLSSEMEKSYWELLAVIDNQDMNKCCIEIDIYTARTLICSDFSLFLGCVHASLDSIGNDVFFIRNLVSDMEEMLVKWKSATDQNRDKLCQLEKSLKNARPISLIGPTHEIEYSHFADIRSLADKNFRISGMIIRSGDIVDAIQLIYEDHSVSRHLNHVFLGGLFFRMPEIRGIMFGNDMGGGVHQISFEENDTLASISGKYGVGYWDKNVLSKLYIHTRLGKTYGPYGDLDAGGKDFELKVPEGSSFRGIFGSAYMDKKKGNVADIGLVVEKAFAL